MLHVVGNLCRDTTLYVERFPEPGETLMARDSLGGWGGKGLNQAVAAARAGADVVLHAAVGADDIPAILGDLSGRAWPVLKLDGARHPTDTSILLVRTDGENVIVSATNRAQGFEPLGGCDPLRLSAGDTLLMQGNLPRHVTEVCLDHAKRNGAWTVLNPSPLWDEPIDWRRVDLVVLNRGELRRLTALDDPEAGGRRLREAGADAVVVTLGPDGALLLDKDRSLAVPAPRVVARDTTGAGDVFCGVLAARFGAGVAPEAGLSLAIAAAALSVTRAGALASCPTAEDLTRLAASNPMDCFE